MNSYPPQYAYPSAPPAYRVLPNPPRLHWGWVLVLNVLTRGLFGAAWLLVIANWVRKVNGKSRAFVWSVVHLCFFPFIFVAAIVAGILSGVTGADVQAVVMPVMIVALVGVLVLYLATVFLLKGELEEAPIEIPLGGVMTFLFSAVYFQYHLRDFQFFGEADGSRFGVAQGVVPVANQYLPSRPQEWTQPAPPSGGDGYRSIMPPDRR